jgi:hypothetical protein
MGTPVDTAAEKEAKRSAIEQEHNSARVALEEQYVKDRNDLESAYHDDLKDNRQAKEAAFVAAGLNPDGSDPQGRPQGSTE